MSTPSMVLYDRKNCDAVVLTKRLELLNAVRSNLLKYGKTTALFDAAIEEVEMLLGEHLPELPKGRQL